mgnify:CR=1 FL=1
MNNLIFLDEQRIKKQLELAYENLVSLRTLVCEGFEIPEGAIETAEKTINELEGRLDNLIIGQ